MSVVAVHAGTQSNGRRRRPGAAREALATIETTTRSALWRCGGCSACCAARRRAEQQAPAPGLETSTPWWPTSCGRASPSRCGWRGDRTDVPAEFDLAAYRIVQEALTNVIKHAGPVRVTVAVRYTDDAVTVEVDDEGPAGAARGRCWRQRGHGLVGMREARRHVSRRPRCRTSPDRRLPRRGAPPVRGGDVTVRVGVVDDQPLIRTGLRSMIDHAADIELVGEAADGEEAVELARRHGPM